MRHVGLIVPSSNVATEMDFIDTVPGDVALHSSRLLMDGATLAEAAGLVDEAPRAARELGTLEPDVVVFACTAAGASLGPDGEARLIDELAELARAPVVSTNAAVAAEIARHAPRSMAILTPYTDDITAEVVAARERHGHDVVHAAGMGIARNRDIARVEPEAFMAFAERELDGRAFELLFVSCTNLRTAALAAPLRRRFGVPVVTSNGASITRALLALG